MGTFNAESAQLPGVTGSILQGQSSTHTVPIEIILLCSETSEERMKLSRLQLRFKLHRVCRSVRTSMAGQIDCNGSKALYQVWDEMAENLSLPHKAMQHKEKRLSYRFCMKCCMVAGRTGRKDHLSSSRVVFVSPCCGPVQLYTQRLPAR